MDDAEDDHRKFARKAAQAKYRANAKEKAQRERDQREAERTGAAARQAQEPVPRKPTKLELEIEAIREAENERLSRSDYTRGDRHRRGTGKEQS